MRNILYKFKVYEYSSLFKFMNSSSFQIYNLEFPGLSFQLFPWLLYTHMHPYSYIYMKLFSILILIFPSVQFTQSCLTLWDPIDSSTLGFPVHYQLSEFASTHICPYESVMPSNCHLSSPSPSTFNFPSISVFSFFFFFFFNFFLNFT